MVTLLDKALLPEAAAFIARLNQQPEHGIGYCGSDSQEVQHSLRHLEDVPFERAFVGSYHEGRLVALLGFDANLEVDEAELWGPFADMPDWESVCNGLWLELRPLLPPSVRRVILFCERANLRAQAFAARHGFQHSSDEIILGFRRERLTNLEPPVVRPLRRSEQDTFSHLHDSLFPGSYYAASTILTRLSPQRQVLVLDESPLQGYVYLEAEPTFGEGRLEFIGVAQEARRQGRARQLLTGALHALFSFEGIEEISLCVNAERREALGLYERVGFGRLRELRAYRLEG